MIVRPPSLDVRVIVFVLGAVVSFAGCSGSKQADSSSDATAAAVAASADPGATASTDAGAEATASDVDSYDPCKKLTAADVQPLYSGPISMKKEDDLTSLLRGCIFRTASKHSLLQIVTTTGAMAQANYTDALTRNGVAKPVPGIGDKAVRDPAGMSVYAMKGDVFCMADSDSQSRDELRGAEAYSGKPLPDAIADRLALKVGALCEKIFAN